MRRRRARAVHAARLVRVSAPAYAELHCLTHFSFGRGASSARELFERAKQQGYAALAITDEATLAGIVRAWEAAKATGVPLIVGSELRLADGLRCVLLVEDDAGYRRLCELISLGRRRSAKGEYRLQRADLDGDTGGLLALWLPGAEPDAGEGEWLRERFPGRCWLAVELHRGPDDDARLAALQALAARLGLPAVAAGDAHMHARGRRALQDVLTATRHHLTVAGAGAHLFPNGERHLRTRRALAAIYPRELLDQTLCIAARCRFELGDLRYQYPHELVPDGHTPTSWLRVLTERGMARRWPGGTPEKVRRQVDEELELIAELRYEAFFLTVHDIVVFARGQGILCQGRGSAANSAVCFALGITEADPARMNLLFGRFLSKERNEPPDIDVDFEHERREEVIQYVYRKYGRERAALAATVICYRGKSAVRDVARALGLPPDQVDQLSRCFAWWDGEAPVEERLRERGFDPEAPVLRRVLALTRQLLDAPRHLSQHVGGFVISDQPLHHLVPVQNAAMPERTIIEWDKDDLESLGLLKVDCLALGMLTAVSKCLALLREHRGRELTPATIPAEDPDTYAMIRRADTIGVFQIESRAQMAMLPRLKPRTFYDLVIQVAIVRPGPIQGKMVHPYLQRRQGLEPVDYPSRALEEVFRRTLGVPLFQEQVMQVAIVAAGFSAGEADELRRGMAAWKRRGGLEHFRERLFAGLAKNGYDTDFAERIFEQIRGFGSYGFPESHAASFALITYVSCWLKCHEPAAFTCALMNSQPLGFYSNSQLVQDARRHGIAVRPVDVRHSHWDNTLEPWPGDAARQPALRLGLREVAGLAREAGERLVAARAARPFDDVADLCHRAGLDERARSLLAEAGALRGLAGHRHRARWAVGGVEKQLPLFAASPAEDAVQLPVPSAGEDLLADYARLGLTLGPHPLALLRRQLAARRYRRSRELRELPNGSRARAAGLVTMRQRPETAGGTTFVTLEDEDGMVNVVVWRDLGERQRRVLVESRLLGVEGRWETLDGVSHLIASRLHDESALAGQLDSRSRNFR
ncbi:error-prone DNA polymerase [Arenimonas caeni]|uniref:error-prone DNA polymerase n=1 Tax=Arenimonas caeni TaxID=2058085 RepID=UPI001F06A0F2